MQAARQVACKTESQGRRKVLGGLLKTSLAVEANQVGVWQAAALAWTNFFVQQLQDAGANSAPMELRRHLHPSKPEKILLLAQAPDADNVALELGENDEVCGIDGPATIIT